MFNLIRDLGFFSHRPDHQQRRQQGARGEPDQHSERRVRARDSRHRHDAGHRRLRRAGYQRRRDRGHRGQRVCSRCCAAARDHPVPIILSAFLAAAWFAILFGAFNGTLVAVFKIQPMIATLILFTAGRSIAYWINGGATPTVESPLLGNRQFHSRYPRFPRPILIVVVLRDSGLACVPASPTSVYTRRRSASTKNPRA